MTEIEIGSNLTNIILQVITVIIGYLSAKGLLKICRKKKNGNNTNSTTSD